MTADSLKFLTPDQLRRVLDHVRLQAKYAPSYYHAVDELLVNLAYYTGLRRFELCNLRIGDVPPAGTESPYLQVRGGKKRGPNHVDRQPLPPGLLTLCRQFITSYRIVAGPDEPLFVTEWGNKLPTQRINERFQQLRDACGLVRFTPHMLRHTYVSMAIRLSGDLALAQQLARHKNIQTTNGYAHPLIDAGHQTVGAMWEQMEPEDQV